MLCQLHFWLGKSGGRDHEGRHYIWKTIKDMVAQTGFSKSTCCRIQADFEALGIIIVKKLNKSHGDHTNFFTIDYDVLNSLFVENESIRETIETDNTIKTTTTAHVIVDKWNKVRGEVVSLSKNLLKQVERVLKEYFDGCVEEMEKFFKYVQGADCLSGRSKSGFVARPLALEGL